MPHPDKLPCSHEGQNVSVFGDRAKCFECPGQPTYKWVKTSVKVVPAHWEIPVPASVKKAAETFSAHREPVTA